MGMIEVDHLTKTLGNKRVLNDISLYLDPGKIFGLTGDNGCGKSVFLKCICGLMPYDNGTIRIDGRKVLAGGRDQPFIGCIIEHTGFIGTMSGFENLRYLAGIRGIIHKAQIIQTLQEVGLEEAMKVRVQKYSLGMRQRLAIAQAIMEDPDVLILDEPFNALDYDATLKVQQLLRARKDKGKLILLVSHHPSDLEMLCDVTFEMNNGQIKERS